MELKNITEFTVEKVAYCTAAGEVKFVPAQKTFEAWLQEATKLVEAEPETVDAILGRLAAMSRAYVGCPLLEEVDYKASLTKWVASELEFAAERKNVIVALWAKVEASLFENEFQPDVIVATEGKVAFYAVK